MTTGPAMDEPAASGRLSAAWPPFARTLATVLATLKEDQFLVLAVKHSGRFVQFAAQGSVGLRMETMSNNHLEKSQRLDAHQMSALTDAGWRAPTGAHDDALPERDPDGSPNYCLDIPSPVSYEAAAELAVRTLATILRVPHPGFLEYTAFDDDGHAIALPVLGLKHAKREAPAGQPHDLAAQLLATLREATGIGDLEYDEDGDVSVRSGSAVIFVRLLENPPLVRITSPVLRDVEEEEDVYPRLNDINANEALARFVFRNGIIYCVASVSAEPYVGAHVTQLLVHFCAIADGMDDLLLNEFGGRTFFDEMMPSTLKH